MVNKIFRILSDDRGALSRFLKKGLDECALTLKEGGVIVYPTETLYGLGVDITNEQAISQLIKLKRRPKSMPIAISVADQFQAEQVVKITNFAKKIIKSCLPKPITILFPVRDSVSRALTGGSDLLGLRFPDNPITIALLKRFGPITATSANVHGDPDPVNINPIIEQFKDEVDIFIDTGPCKFGKPSTVVDISDDTIKIIRDGACSGKQLKECM